MFFLRFALWLSTFCASWTNVDVALPAVPIPAGKAVRYVLRPRTKAGAPVQVSPDLVDAAFVMAT